MNNFIEKARDYINTPEEMDLEINVEEVLTPEEMKDGFKAGMLICARTQDMLRQLPDDSVHLIYLDPPYCSGRTFDTVFDLGDGAKKFFAFEDLCKHGIIGYVNRMIPIIKEMHRILKPTGSICVHLDYHVVHYMKVVLDEIFGIKNFRNEIIWHYKSVSNTKNDFARKHDTILRYVKSEIFTFNTDDVRVPYDEKTISRYENPVEFPGGYTAKMNEKGKILDDVWTIPPVRNVSKEKVDFDTQKPKALLERIILACSNPKDIVLDPFSGSGTTVETALDLERKPIGIDIDPGAIIKTKHRIQYSLVKVYGIEDEKIRDFCKTRSDLQEQLDDLRVQDPFKFEHWVVTQFKGIINVQQRGDGGVDGFIPETSTYIQVKRSDKIGPGDYQKFMGALFERQCNNGIFAAFSFTPKVYEKVETNLFNGLPIKIELFTIEEILIKDSVIDVKEYFAKSNKHIPLGKFWSCLRKEEEL